jgi:hypothetical protein
MTPNWWHSQVSFSTLGLIFLLGAVVSTCTGKTLARGHRGLIDRNKEPSEFWWVVALYYLAAIFFFYYHLYGRPW